MKKVLIILVVCVLLLFNTDLSSKTMGLKLGLNFTKYTQTNIQSMGEPVTFDEFSITENKRALGLSIGFFYTFDISKKFQIQPEINYLNCKMNYAWNKNFWSNPAIGGFPSEIGELINSRRELNLIQIPVLLKYKISKFSVLAGPYFSYLLKGRDMVEAIPLLGITEGVETDLMDEEDNPGVHKRLNYGLVFGIEFEKGTFVGGIRYSFDLSDNSKDVEDYMEDGVIHAGSIDQLKYNSTSILVGWRF